ncbi:MAG TPA: GNAT family N-acetyltransferase [Polyangiaceae bacterium]|nr:GNAT family N-acetyltransferase [Polyangiaceae bacterium]
MRIEPLSRGASASDLDELGELLCDAVASGASVSFLPPLTLERARAYWIDVIERAHRRAVTLVARDERGIAGSVQLQPASVQNQPHRAEVAKLLVHRRARRRGVGRALMAELEKWATLGGFTLLTLDTKLGDAGELLYEGTGWQRAGQIPGYALDAEGTPCATVLFYKQLQSESPPSPRASSRGWL